MDFTWCILPNRAMAESDARKIEKPLKPLYIQLTRPCSVRATLSANCCCSDAHGWSVTKYSRSAPLLALCSIGGCEPVLVHANTVWRSTSAPAIRRRSLLFPAGSEGHRVPSGRTVSPAASQSLRVIAGILGCSRFAVV